MTAPYSNEFSLVDLLIAEQADMTAIERFSTLQARHGMNGSSYRNLVPLTRPGPGEQYAFKVDLDRCSGCKACVSACHSLNGLDEDEMWRSVGTLIGQDEPYLQTVTTACHHCVEPACASGCPVLAYEKDPSSGIVRHLDDQCIGCQYCVLKCPYDVPKYSARRGIVRKCDLCHNRLAAGEAPACAEACPHEAIQIEIVSQEAIRETGVRPGARMIAGAFPSSYTLPTTSFLSRKAVPERLTAAAEHLRREDPHWPLVFMLVLTQMAAGLHLVGAILAGFGYSGPERASSIAAAAILGAGLGTSVFHLGRPLKAWRAFLGWRTSWMSREILAFSVYAACSAGLLFAPANAGLSIATACLGLGAVACSAMIYVDTRRPGWSGRSVFRRFMGSALLLGPAAVAAIAGWASPLLMPALSVAAIASGAALFVWGRIIPVTAQPGSTHGRIALNAMRLAPRAVQAEACLLGVSTVLFVFAIFDVQALGWFWAGLACVSAVGGQILDRWLFFVATPAARMPSTLHV